MVLDDKMAFSLGTNPEMMKLVLLFLSVVAVAVVIAVSGIVSWAGLIAPHISRKLFGADSKHSLPGAVLIGAGGVLLCDNIGRSLFANEIPLGIVTSLVGGVVFFMIMTRTGKVRND